MIGIRAALIAGLSLVTLTACGGGLHGGPVSSVDIGDQAHGDVTGMLVESGQRVVFGNDYIHNSGHSPITLTSASLYSEEGVPPGVEVLDEVWVLDAEKQSFAVGMWGSPDIPARSQLTPLEGYVVDPDRTVKAVFVVDVLDAGEWFWPGVEVEYEYQGLPFSTLIYNGFQVCTDPANDCFPPDEDE